MTFFEVMMRVLIGSLVAGVVAGLFGFTVLGMTIGMYFIVTAIAQYCPIKHDALKIDKLIKDANDD